VKSPRNAAPRGPARETIPAITVAVLIAAGISWAAWGRGGTDDDSDDEASTPVSLEAPAALDPDVRAGTLDNGMRYYVRANTYPEGHAELRLVVDAGSVLEDDDQRGLAHAVEHMAFRGTRRFPGRTIDEYLQSVGMRLGEDINATTSYDETVYRLTIPTERKPVVDSALMILADWAHGVTFDSAAARQEAPVVFEEWRSHRDAAERLDEARDTLLLRGSRYAARAVIGDTATLRRFDVGAMRRFYRDWYRPDRMAVVVVGDFDARSMERAVRRHFEPIPRAAGGRTAPNAGQPGGSQERVVLLTDPEIAATRVSLWYPRVPRPRRTVGDYRRGLVERIARTILRDRLQHDADQPGSALLSAGISLRHTVRPVETHVVGATLVDARAMEGIATLGAAIEKLRRFGPKPSELTAVKESILLERRKDVSGSPESSGVADQLVQHFLTGTPVPGNRAAYRWTNDLLGGIAANDVTTFLEQLAPDRAPTVVIVSPAGQQTRVDRHAVIAALDSVSAGITDEPTDSIAVALMAEVPRSGAVRSRRTLGKIDAQEWQLANGMRVLLKPTDFADDEVELRLAAPGGASLASREDYSSAYMADNILVATGAGGVNGYDLARLLDARSVTVDPTVSDDRVEISGSGRRGDLEMMLQVAHLYLTSPREDTAAFRRYQERLRAFARNRAADPDAIFEDTVAAALRPGDPRALRSTAPFVESVDMGKAFRFWRARASNASNFTAVIVGDFEMWQVTPLIERYLGSLPAGHAEAPADVGLGRPAGVVERTLQRGMEPRAFTRIVIGDTLSLTLDADAALDATRDVLDMVLYEKLREQMGGTYGVSVDVEVRRTPRPSFVFAIEFSAAPERVDTLAAAALAEIERLRTRGPTPGEAEKVRKAAIEHNDEQSRGNTYWANELEWHSLTGWSLEAIARHGDDAAKVSAASLQAACARYLDGRRFVRVTRLPEGSP
jgi:zinc protease